MIARVVGRTIGVSVFAAVIFVSLALLAAGLRLSWDLLWWAIR